MCTMYCEYGFQTDEHGCDICKCRDTPSGIQGDEQPRVYRYWPGLCLTIHYSDVIMGTMAYQITSLVIVYLSDYSGTDEKKTSKLRVTGLCAGNSPVTGEFPAQMASRAENHLMTSSWKTVFSSIGIPIIKRRRSLDHLIFTMGIPILARWHRYNETDPRIWVMSLQWRHISVFITVTSHKCRNVSDHRQRNCLFRNLFQLTTTKSLKNRITGLLWGRFPSQRASGVEMSSWWWIINNMRLH